MANTNLDAVTQGNTITLAGVTYNVTEFDAPSVATATDGATEGGLPAQYIIKIFIQSQGDTGQNRAADYGSVGDDPRLPTGSGEWDPALGIYH